MRKFIVVLKYELKEYFTNKVFIGLTLFLALLGAAALFLPRFVDLSGITGVQVTGEADQEEASPSEEEKEVFLYVDKAGVVRPEILQQIFPHVSWQEAADETSVKTKVEAEEAGAGFVVTGPTEYEYYIFNKSMNDRNSAAFDQAMQFFYRMD